MLAVYNPTNKTSVMIETENLEGNRKGNGQDIEKVWQAIKKLKVVENAQVLIRRP